MDRKLMSILVIAAIVIGGYFLYTSGNLPGIKPSGDVTNGYFHVESGECRIRQDMPNGQVFNSDDFGGDFDSNFQCCFNAAQQQIDCNDVTKLLGPFAIYDSQVGKFWVQYGFLITNEGTVPLTNAWIDSSTWTKDVSSIETPTAAQLTEMDRVFLGIVGSAYGQALPNVNDFFTLSTDGISKLDLQLVGGTAAGAPIIYNWVLVSKATALGLPETPDTQTALVTIQKEGIAFSVDITTGLTGG